MAVSPQFNKGDRTFVLPNEFSEIQGDNLDATKIADGSVTNTQFERLTDLDTNAKIGNIAFTTPPGSLTSTQQSAIRSLIGAATSTTDIEVRNTQAERLTFPTDDTNRASRRMSFTATSGPDNDGEIRSIPSGGDTHEIITALNANRNSFTLAAGQYAVEFVAVTKLYGGSNGFFTFEIHRQGGDEEIISHGVGSVFQRAQAETEHAPVTLIHLTEDTECYLQLAIENRNVGVVSLDVDFYFWGGIKGEPGPPGEYDADNQLDPAFIDGLHDVATSGDYNDLTGKPTIPTVPARAGAFTAADEARLDAMEDNATADQSATEIRDALQGLSGGARLAASAIKDLPAAGEENVQADWSITDTNSDAYIQNKPTIPDITTKQDTIDADNKLSGTLISDDTITATQIAADAVTNSELATNAVRETHIMDGSVSHTKLASNAVESDNIANSNVTHDHLATDAVEADNIKDEAVTNAKLGADAVDGNKIKDDAIAAEHIANDTVLTAHIADANITAAKLDVDSDAKKEAFRTAIGAGTGADFDATTRLDADFIGGGNVSNAEFDALDGVTSAIQGQLDGKHPSITTSVQLPATHVSGLDPIATSGTVPAANVSGLATVATTGSYANLSGTPTIPAAISTSNPLDAAFIHDGSVTNTEFAYLGEAQVALSNANIGNVAFTNVPTTLDATQKTAVRTAIDAASTAADPIVGSFPQDILTWTVSTDGTIAVNTRRNITVNTIGSPESYFTLGTDDRGGGGDNNTGKIIFKAAGTYRLYGDIQLTGNDRTGPSFDIDGATIVGCSNPYNRDADTAFWVNRTVDFTIDNADTVCTLQVLNKQISDPGNDFPTQAMGLAALRNLRIVAVGGTQGIQGEEGPEGPPGLIRGAFPQTIDISDKTGTVTAGGESALTVSGVGSSEEYFTQGTGSDTDKIVITNAGTYRLYGSIRFSSDSNIGRSGPSFTVTGTGVVEIGHSNEYSREADDPRDVSRFVDFTVQNNNTIVTLYVSNRQVSNSDGGSGQQSQTITLAADGNSNSPYETSGVINLRIIALGGTKGEAGPPGNVGLEGVDGLWKGNRAAYDAISTKDANTIYHII